MIIKQLQQIIEQILLDNGFELVRVKYLGSSKKTLQIMCEDKEGNMSAGNCAKISRLVAPEIDELMAENTILEVSSPGIDRPLTRIKDYINWQGFEAKVTLVKLMANRRRLRGIISVTSQTKDDGTIIILEDGKNEEIIINFEDVSEAKLVLNKELLNSTNKIKRKI